MSQPFPVTIFHNPMCGTSRNTLAMIEGAGHRPTIVPYLETGWTVGQLDDLLSRAGLEPRDILRAKEPLAAELGLTDAGVSRAALLEAMVAHPVLVERPIVATPKGVRLCRPADKVREIL